MSKIKRYDGLPRVTRIPEGGTDGAILGVNLRDVSGRLIQPSEVLNPTDDGSRPTASTIWRLIREIPANIQKVAALAGIGFTTRGSDGAWYQRILQPGTGINVQNGDGVAGDPTIGLADLANGGGGALVKITRDAKGRVSGTSAATTNDLTEGSSNLYYTDVRADARANAAVAAHVAQADPHPQYTTTAEAAAAAPVQSVNARTGAVAVPDFVSKTTAPTATDYGRALVNGDRWRNTNNGVLYTYQDGAWLYDNAASLSRYVPARLSTGAASPIPLNADGTIPARLSNGTQSNIPTQA